VWQSTPEEKYRRHKNKKRIWRRAVRRFAQGLVLETAITVTIEAAPLGAASA
jgi:hypothetical protein